MLTNSTYSKKERAVKDIAELIDNVKRNRETEKIVSKVDFKKECLEEI